MRCFCVVTLLLALTSVGSAQETTGSARGRVLSDGRALSDASVVATGPAMLGERRARTATDGIFALLALPPGVYTLHVTAIGYRAVILERVEVHLGRTTGLEQVSLTRLAAGATALDAVRIVARATLDPVGTTIGATLEASELAALPGDRDYKALIAMLPHVNASYHGDMPNSMGATGLENMYFVDGANVTPPSNASAPWGTGSATHLPRNFVKTVEVRSGGYEAEFGRALGAIVNAVTYTGTNTFEYATFGYATHGALSGRPRTVPTLRESGQHSYDVGVRIGGPVLRDRLWYSAALNPSVTYTSRELPSLGRFPDEIRTLVHAAKLTWQPRPTTTLELASFGDAGHRSMVAFLPEFLGTPTPLNPDPYLTRVETGGSTVSMRVRHQLGYRALVDAGVTRSTFRYRGRPEGPQGLEVSYIDELNSTVEGGIAELSGFTEERLSAGLKTTLSFARHTFTAGLDLEDNRSRGFVRTNFIQFNAPSNDSVWARTWQSAAGTVGGEVATAFVQDVWRATPRLTFTGGVRWTDQGAIGASGRRAQHFPNQWQPRVGFSWLLAADGAQRLFGSYGLFYQQQAASLAFLFYSPWVMYTNRYDEDPRSHAVVPFDSTDYSTAEESFPPIRGAKLENTHEVTLGYERSINSAHTITVRGIYRTLGSTFQMGFGTVGVETNFFLGTPGEGNLSFLPPAVRTYAALELTLDGAWRDADYRLSYVLSRAHGNYTGLYSSDSYHGLPGNNHGLMTPEHMSNTTGLLPNDRAHVVKLAASRALGQAWEVGALVTAASGTPINELGVSEYIPVFRTFLSPRGSVGRTPTLYDAALRVRHVRSINNAGQLAVVLDLMHLGNPRETVRVDMTRYLAVSNGVHTSPNPNYLRPTAFQPPMTVRLGVELTR